MRSVLLLVAIVCGEMASNAHAQFEKQGPCEILARKINQQLGKGVEAELGTISRAHGLPLKDRLESDYEERGRKSFLWPADEFPADKLGFGRYLAVTSPERLALLRERAQGMIKRAESTDASERAMISEADRELIQSQGGTRIRLYGDLLLTEALLEVGRSVDAAKVVAEARARGDIGSLSRTDLNANKLELTTGELSCRLAALEVQAKLGKLPSEPSELLRLFGQVLDQADAILPYIRRPEAISELLASIARLNFGSLIPHEAASWQQTEAFEKLGPLAGLVQTESGWTVFVQGEQLHVLLVDRRGKLNVLTGEDAYNHFNRICTVQLNKFTNQSMTLFNVSKRWGETVVTIAGRQEGIVLRKEEAESIARGEPLPADHLLTQAIQGASEKPFVLFANPLMRRDGPALREADAFAFALQRCYPEKPIFRDPPSENTARRAAEVRDFELSDATNLVAVIPKDSFADPTRFGVPTDGKLIQNIEDELADAGIRINRFDPTVSRWEDGKEKALLVITGHIDEKLVKYVRALGDAGAFKDKLVVFTSCQFDASGRVGVTRQLIGEISERYGARGVFGYEGIIRISQLEPFFLELAKRVKALTGNKGANFDQLLRSTLKKFGLNGIWTICRDASNSRCHRAIG